jgi:hypothetical protein
MHMHHVSLASTPVMRTFLLCNPRGRLRYNLCIVRWSCFSVRALCDGDAAYVCGAATARRVDTITLITLNTFADDAAIGVRGVVFGDIGCACGE